MKIVVNKEYIEYKDFIKEIPFNFDCLGEIVYEGRNTIRSVSHKDKILNIKSFKKPNLINKFVYRYFRASKAERSYYFAERLLHLGIKTPINIAFVETRAFLIGRTFYISEHLDYDFTILDVLEERVVDRVNIIRQFVSFTNSLHRKRILHLDYSPGNILIKKNKGNYEFYLVDINRMKFTNVSIKMGIKNFSKLWSSEEMITIISEEYASLNNISYDYVYNRLSKYDIQHKAEVNNKAKIKEKIKDIFGGNKQ